MVAFLLPTATAVTDGLLRGLYVRHPLDESESAAVLATYDAIMLRFIVFVMGVHATLLAAVLGMLQGRAWAVQIVPVMLGLTMISVGNLLPRTRPNLAIGIRTPRTLSDRAFWVRTHRMAGYTVVSLGFVIVLAAIAVPPPIGSGDDPPGRSHRGPRHGLLHVVQQARTQLDSRVPDSRFTWLPCRAGASVPALHTK